MDMDKELALIFDFKDAPEELKSAANTHRANCLALIQAKLQMKQAEDNLASSQLNYDGSNQAFRSALKNWTPTPPQGGE